MNEILQVLVQNGRYTEALDEIELFVISPSNIRPPVHSVVRYLPSFPYQDNPVLHIYAGSICLYMSQDPDSRQDHKSPDSLLEEAKAHFNRVVTIDPQNCMAHIFLDQVSTWNPSGPGKPTDPRHSPRLPQYKDAAPRIRTPI